MTATGKTVKIGEVEIQEHSDVFSYTIPSDATKLKPEYAEQAGKKLEDLPFSFGQVSDENEAIEVCKAKEWTLVSFVNEALRSNARANAYNTEATKWKLAEVSPEKVFERMVNDAVRLGVSEDMARKMVASMLAAK